MDDPIAIPESFERPGGLLSELDPHLVLYHDPQSLHAEQYRTFRTNLLALNPEGGPKALVLTSSMKGEGKSVTAANIAACLAELPSTRVCLVDVDFRMPSQATLWGMKAEAGLSELLSDEISLKQALLHTVVDGLDLMTPGKEPSNPAQLLGSDRFVNLLRELKRQYSWVLIDTPPVNPYTDAAILTTVADGAILVVRMLETPRSLVQQSMRNIESAGGRVLGTFLTGLAEDRDDSARYGYYRVDAGDRTLAKQERRRTRERKKLERALRKKEKAVLKARRRAEEQDRPDDL